MRKVCGILEINWSVVLPDGKEDVGTSTNDPAIGALLDFLPQSGQVYLWGEDEKPADIFIEYFEEDVVIEEDERE
jgi:hypothetical protein